MEEYFVVSMYAVHVVMCEMPLTVLAGVRVYAHVQSDISVNTCSLELFPPVSCRDLKLQHTYTNTQTHTHIQAPSTG